MPGTGRFMEGVPGTGRFTDGVPGTSRFTDGVPGTSRFMDGVPGTLAITFKNGVEEPTGCVCMLPPIRRKVVRSSSPLHTNPGARVDSFCRGHLTAASGIAVHKLAVRSTSEKTILSRATARSNRRSVGYIMLSRVW